MTEQLFDAFFRKYGTALATGDLDGIADCYGYPGLVVFDDGAMVVAEAEEIRKQFDGAAERYQAEGLVAAVPEILQVQRLTDVIAAADVRWSYQDTQGVERGTGTYRYLLRTADGAPKITVVVVIEQ